MFPASVNASEGVILLHGLCRRSSSMQKMAKALEASGFIVVNQSYPSREGSIEELSEQAIGEALDDPRLSGCGKIHFVTHSLGGILVRSYFKRHHTERLGRVVMLGPPNRGSEVVDRIGRWGLFKALNGPAGSELGTNPDSTPNQLGGVDFELGVIAGDRSINWINSAMIDGPDDGKVSVERTRVDGMKDHIVVHVTHPFLMKRKRVIDLTIKFLKFGSFAIERRD
jgi:pimeloyl-ACP methyl ester carboxylesterase